MAAEKVRKCLLVWILIWKCSFGREKIEPSCLSRFDYDYKMLTKMVEMESEQKDLKDIVKDLLMIGQKLQTTIDKQAIDIRTLRENIKAVDMDNHYESGTTYVRWGRTSCPNNGTDFVYNGIAAGSYYDHTGAAADYICMPKDPIWGHYEGKSQTGGAYVYGNEYQLEDQTLSNFFKTKIEKWVDDAPCSVCRTTRPSILMIPGRNQCYDGWTKEYSGYLVSGYHGHKAASEYVCLDGDPEILTGAKHKENLNGKLFYFAVAKCGSLPCPPYVEGRELTCVVCSK